MRSKINSKLFRVFLICILIFLGASAFSQAQRSTKITEQEDIITTKDLTLPDEAPGGYRWIGISLNDPQESDKVIEKYMKELFPIIESSEIDAIKGSKKIFKKLVNDTLGHVEFTMNILVPEHYLDPEPVLLWELNIPEFASRIFQIYNSDTIQVAYWPNVVGAPSTKTYTGYYNIFRIRNWPSWKDPEAPPDAPATPPGPGNPLGLFAAHYDENSLRYFHGTNKNHLLKNQYRALSHGCVRNDNANIDKMKRMIVTKMVKSKDISWWVNSKKSLIYDFTEEEKIRFPVRIIYKTFNIDRDIKGDYIIFFKDVYGYEKGSRLSKFDEPQLVTFATLENIISEYKSKHKPDQIQLSDDKLVQIVKKLLTNRKEYQKYYFDDLVKEIKSGE